MKTLIISGILALTVSANVFAGGKDKLTLKEKVDQAKEVRIYFSNYDITHKPNTNPPQGSTNGGTGCAKFNETTVLPQEYEDAAKQIIELLNKGLNTAAFVEGDVTAVPVKSTIGGINDYDWLKHGDQLFAHVVSKGNYVVSNDGLMGEMKLSNTLTVTSTLTFYEIANGKVKLVSTKQIVWAKTNKLETAQCDDHAYFVKNFPANSLVERFKSLVSAKTAVFVEKEMKKYNKAMKKKK